MTLEFDDLLLSCDLRDVSGTTPVLFLHSALASGEELEGLRALFPERTTISLDLPGHGKSTTTRDAIDTAWIGQVLSDMLDRLDVPMVDIIGYSLGGYVGLELAALAPKKVRSVVSHAMKYYWTPEAIEAAIETFSKAPVSPRTVELTATLLRNFNERQLSVADIRHSNVPTLITTGALDNFVTAPETEKLARAIAEPQATWMIFPDVKHSLRSLPLDTFESAIRQFWDGMMQDTSLTLNRLYRENQYLQG
jgi:pimeloyl-ACP methyl ester carboxylesterase